MMTTPTLSPTHTLAQAARVLDVEIHALLRLQNNLNDSFQAAIDLLHHCTGRVIVTGMGKSGLIARKIAATFSSTGTPAFFLHPGEGVHGDLGMLSSNDVVIALSNSGETTEILQILPVLKHLELPIIALTGAMQSTLAQRSQVVLDVSVEQEACPLNLAPTASTTAALAMGDALAIVLMEQKGITSSDFALFHPAGSLGKRLLLTVEDVMHTGDAMPIVTLETPFKQALLEITTKKLGMTLVLDTQGQLQGIITDGDVRRVLTQHTHLDALTVADVYTANPKTIEKTALAATALGLMEHHQITVLAVSNAEGIPQGVLHLHDLLKTGI